MNLNTDVDANVAAEILKWPKRTFFQHDSKLNETIKLITPMTSTYIFPRKDGGFIQNIEFF